MRGDEESESRLVATERADDVITSIERDVENMERVEFLTPGSDDDKQFELEMKRERIYGRERVSGDTGGVDSLLHSNPEKAEKKKSQKRTRVTRRPRPVPNQLHVNNSFDDTDSSISEAQEVLMSKEGLFISQNEPPSSSEENVCCTEATLLHQTPQKMLLEGYGEEPAAVENWEFSCAWDNHNLVQGHLFVCRTSVVFVGDNFGKMAETQIHYVDIVKINKGMSNLFVPNAITFKSIDCVRIFRHFWERDKCFERIMEAKSICERRMKLKTRGEDNSPTLANSIRRSLFSPRSATTSTLNTMLSGGDRTLVCQSAPTTPTVTPTHALKGSTSNNSQKKMKMENSQHQVMLHDDTTNEEEPDCHLKWNDLNVGETERSRQLIEEMVDTCDGGGSYSDVVTAELPVSLEDFYRSFICDDAPYSIVMFHFARGDWEVDPTTWRGDVDLDIDGTPKTGDKEARKRALYRVIRFKTPLSVQFISCPSQVRTAKRQRLCVFGGAGIVYDTVTSVEDRIILSDNFHVEDRWVVQPSGESNERCVVSVKYRVVWKKFTVLKSLIESKVRSDVTSFNTAFVDGMREYLTGAHMGSAAIQRHTSERAKPSTITIGQTIKSMSDLPFKRFIASVGPITMVIAALCMMYFAVFWLHFQLLNTGPFTFFLPSTCRESLTLDSRTSVHPSFGSLYINLGEANVALRVALHQQVELCEAISAINSGSGYDAALASAATTSMKDVQETLSSMENVMRDIYNELASITSVKQGIRK